MALWRVLDRDAKRRACISQAPAKEPFCFLRSIWLKMRVVCGIMYLLKQSDKQ